MWAINTLKRVLSYIWHIITAPFRFYRYAFSYDAPEWMMACAIFSIAVVVVGSFVGSFITILIYCVNQNEIEKSKSNAEILKQEALHRAARDQIIAECKRKGGMYVFAIDQGDMSSSFMCVDATRIRLESEK